MTTIRSVDKKIFLQETQTKERKHLITFSKIFREIQENLHSDFFIRLSKEIQAVASIPFERHKLSRKEILKICVVADKILETLIPQKEIIYLRAKESGLSRSLVIDGKRNAFTILSKKFGNLFASGTFKKVTDAIDITKEGNISAQHVVRLVNKAGKHFREKELALHERFEMIITRVQYPSKKRSQEIKTTIIEKAYDHDLHTFTNNSRNSQHKKISLPDLVSVLSQIEKTLSSLHNDGYAHQDLKTKNVLYKKELDGSVQAKLIDFGHVIRPTATEQVDKNQNHHYGTIRYGAPELLDTALQLPSLLEQRQAEDMYALGCLLYELLFFKPLPWGRYFYFAFKGPNEEISKKKALERQRAVPKQLRLSTEMPSSTLKEQLQWIASRLLDSNPATRMHISELCTALKNLISQ